MVGKLSFDTTFLIDLQKEKLAGRRGRAWRFLPRHESSLMAISSVAVGEFAEGFTRRDDPAFLSLIAAFEVLEVDLEISWLYGQTARRLRRHGRLIGSNDLWIACSAVRHALPLVTRDATHFRRVPDLEVIPY